mmetsp:Transcript_33088/g.104634  ORF Transcript_33088/g.104634 Transcript_33088/m.104634 type:complete len:207 (-) Transcript_33088:1258-1878(-)
MLCRPILVVATNASGIQCNCITTQSVPAQRSDQSTDCRLRSPDSSGGEWFQVFRNDAQERILKLLHDPIVMPGHFNKLLIRNVVVASDKVHFDLRALSRRLPALPQDVHDRRILRVHPRLHDRTPLDRLDVRIVVVRCYQQREAHLQPRHLPVLCHHLVRHRDHHVAPLLLQQLLPQPRRRLVHRLCRLHRSPESPLLVQVLVDGQ